MVWGVGEVVTSLSFPRWILEALFIVEFKGYTPIFNMTRDAIVS